MTEAKLIKLQALKLSDAGKALIKHFEDCVLEAYPDANGVWTIGWGNTFYEDGKRVKKGDVITQQRADRLFELITPKFELAVKSKLRRDLYQYEFDAAVVFAYNAGTGYKDKGKQKDYNIWKNINERMPAKEMVKYWSRLAITSGGKVLRGLVKRRAAEAHLYATGELALPK